MTTGPDSQAPVDWPFGATQTSRGCREGRVGAIHLRLTKVDHGEVFVQSHSRSTSKVGRF